jgi:hypothetical protein
MKCKIAGNASGWSLELGVAGQKNLFGASPAATQPGKHIKS